MSFGNSLIKQVAGDLKIALPKLSTFVTLSPIPGLLKWLKEKDLMDHIADPEALRALATHYLPEAKREGGLPRNPVKRVHPHTGASVQEVTPAPISENELAQSGGAMVNYLYDLGRNTENHEAFATGQTVTASAGLRSLARKALTNAA